jgi:hypothetical protein
MFQLSSGLFSLSENDSKFSNLTFIFLYLMILPCISWNLAGQFVYWPFLDYGQKGT